MARVAICSVLASLLGLAMGGCAASPAPVNEQELRIDARTVLRQSLESQDPAARFRAVDALAELPDEDAGRTALQALHDPDPMVRFAAAMAVAKLKYEPARERLLKMADESARVEPDKRVLAAVVYALHELEDDRYMGYLGALLYDREPEVRAYAAMLMGRVGEPSATGPLRDLLSTERDKTVSVKAHEALAMLGDPKSSVIIESYVIGYFLDVRLAAIEALTKTNPRRAVYVCQRQVRKAESPHIRVACAGSLAKAGEGTEQGYRTCLRAVREPREMLEDAYEGVKTVDESEVRSLRTLGMMSLAQMDRPGAAGVLQGILDSNDPEERVAAAIAILKLLGPPLREPTPVPPREPEEPEAPTEPVSPVRPEPTTAPAIPLPDPEPTEPAEPTTQPAVTVSAPPTETPGEPASAPAEPAPGPDGVEPDPTTAPADPDAEEEPEPGAIPLESPEAPISRPKLHTAGPKD